MTEHTLPTRQSSGERLRLLMDSTRWDNFPFRDDDIVIGTWAKSGTTWCQQIVTQLIHEGRQGLAAMDLAPWVDMRVLPFEPMLEQLEAQAHRRCLKTHLPARRHRHLSEGQVHLRRTRRPRRGVELVQPPLENDA